MNTYPNIEKSAFRPGEYVGYANGVWRITRGGIGWRAVKREGGNVLEDSTLSGLSQKLEKETLK